MSIPAPQNSEDLVREGLDFFIGKVGIVTVVGGRLSDEDKSSRLHVHSDPLRLQNSVP